jgi:riboflavin synthase
MFTGIISAIGNIKAIETLPEARVLVVEMPYTDLQLGESIAVNGVCLTATKFQNSGSVATVRFDVSPETLNRTNLGKLEIKSVVNLERALRLSDRLSGHIVQGHVDGAGTLRSIKQHGNYYEIAVSLPQSFLKYIVEKGSITLDGISLTVNSIEDSTIYLMIIPHTWTNTILNSKQVGQDFNVELDVIAKHLEKLAAPWTPNRH